MSIKNNTYDQYAEQYANMVAERDKIHIFQNLASYLSECIGDIQGLTILDAGCGEGYLSRMLVSRGAEVTGIDISPRLIEMARSKDSEGDICYQVGDLSKPLPEYEGHFDLVVSHLTLNDVSDYVGFVSTLGSVTKVGGRVIVTMNNPYSAVIREKVKNYFDSGTQTLYQGLASQGVKVYFFHRTLEEYITAFRDKGFLLRSLFDVRPSEEMQQSGDPAVQKHYHFPFFMILEFVKVK